MALGRRMAVGAGDGPMFLVVELAEGQPAVGHHPLGLWGRRGRRGNQFRVGSADNPRPVCSLDLVAVAAPSLGRGTEHGPVGLRQCHVDSAGLETLLWIIDEAAEHGGQVRLVSPDMTVSKILEISRLDRRFNIHDSIESAAKSLR